MSSFVPASSSASRSCCAMLVMPRTGFDWKPSSVSFRSSHLHVPGKQNPKRVVAACRVAALLDCSGVIAPWPLAAQCFVAFPSFAPHGGRRSCGCQPAGVSPPGCASQYSFVKEQTCERTNHIFSLRLSSGSVWVEETRTQPETDAVQVRKLHFCTSLVLDLYQALSPLYRPRLAGFPRFRIIRRTNPPKGSVRYHVEVRRVTETRMSKMQPAILPKRLSAFLHRRTRVIHRKPAARREKRLSVV